MKGVNIDPGVLAAMYANNVVNNHQCGQIHARHERHEPRDVIAAYFANSVLNNWPDAIFEQQMKNLVKVLKESDDQANRSMAEKLSIVMSFEASADFNQSCEVQEFGSDDDDTANLSVKDQLDEAMHPETSAGVHD